MRQVRRPTREQKIAIKKSGYNPEEYLVIHGRDTDESFKIIHKETRDRIDIFY